MRSKGILDQLIAEGRATEAEGDALDVKPSTATPSRRRLSEVLAELRADER